MPLARRPITGPAAPLGARPALWRAGLVAAVTALMPAAARAVVPDCDAAAKALAASRYEHWTVAGGQRAMAVLSDSISMAISSAGEVSFFDAKAYGRRLKDVCGPRVSADTSSRTCVARPERRSVPVSAKPLLDAAVFMRRHNALGVSSAERADAIVRACANAPIRAYLPFNRGLVVMAREAPGDDAHRSICMNGAPFVSEWLNFTRDGGRTWSLQPAIGWCPDVSEPPPAPRQPPTLQHELPRGNPRR